MFEVKIIQDIKEIFSQVFETLNIPRLIQFLNQRIRKPRSDKGVKK